MKRLWTKGQTVVVRSHAIDNNELWQDRSWRRDEDPAVGDRAYVTEMTDGREGKVLRLMFITGVCAGEIQDFHEFWLDPVAMRRSLLDWLDKGRSVR